MVPGNSLTEKAINLAKCGFDGISVFENIETWTYEKEYELLNLEKNTGIKVCEFCFSGKDYGKLMNSDPATAESSMSIYSKAIEICNKLGAVTEMEYEYAPQSPVPLFEPYKKMSDEQCERFCNIFTTLAKQVTGDAILLLEPINRYESPYLNNLKDNADIIEKLNLPHTGLLFDTFHVSMEEVDLCESFRKYFNLIQHVHLGDNNRLLPGRGNLPWPRFFATLSELNYTGFVNIECAVLGDDVMEQLAKVVQFIRSLI